MQPMTRTTGTLTDLAPSFEKPRGDARATHHDKASEAERAAAKKVFGSLLTKANGESEAAVKSGSRAEAVTSPTDPRSNGEATGEQATGKVQTALGVVKALLGRPQTERQDAVNLASTGAGGSDGDLAPTRAERAGMETGLLSDRAKSVPLGAEKNAVLPDERADAGHGHSVPQVMERGEKADSEATHGRQAMAAGKEIPVEGLRFQDRKLDGETETQSAGVSGTEQTDQMVGVEPQATMKAETPVLAVDDEISTEDMPDHRGGAAAAVAAMNDVLPQSDQAVGQVAVSLAATAGRTVPITDPVEATRPAKRDEPRAGATSGNASGGRAASERAALPTASALPELRARLATESATAQRALSLDDQAFEIENNIDADALDGSVRVVKQEGHLSMPTEARGVPTTVFGQLVQSLASTDGLPRIASELKLLAAQGGTNPTPEPLKVLHIQLQPRELGDLAVRIALRGDKIELRVQTARQATANLLMSDQRILVEALQQRNLDVDSVTIQLVEPDRNTTGQPATLPNSGQGRSGQSETFLSGSQGQASREHGDNDGQSGTSDIERHAQQQDADLFDEIGRRRGVYL